MIDLSAIATNLQRGADGLWHSRSHSAVDYPDEGNAFCFQIEDHSFWFRYRNAFILEMVRQFPPPGAVFDIGGGNGFVARALQATGHDTVLVEPGAAGAQNAHRRGVTPVVCAALDDCGFGDAVMPAAGLFDVLEHIDDDRRLLRTLHRLLVPGGRLYLTVPAYNWLWSSEDELGGHHRRYTCGGLAHRLLDTGFVVERTTYVFTSLPLPILLLRALPSRLGRRPKVDLDAIRAELRPDEGVAVRALSAVLDRELAWLRAGRTLPFGGSCLVVARRPVN